MAYELILTDDPRPKVRRITLNRPDKRNPLSNALRSELFDAFEQADGDDGIAVIVIRGAGSSFCAGYDLKTNVAEGQPWHTAGGLGNWPRHVVEGCFRMWDLAKPLIAQVHGYCLAGGTELATGCDLVYVAEDAQIGYPVVRSMSPPDNQFYPWLVGMRRAMEMMLTGDSISGIEAVECGFANRAYPAAALEEAVLAVAERVARVPADIQQINKRAVHRQMEAMGLRAGIRAGTELQQMGMLTQSTQAHMQELRADLTAALTKRDRDFGDYRTKGRE